MGTKRPESASQADYTFVIMNQGSFHSDNMEENDKAARVKKQKQNAYSNFQLLRWWWKKNW